MTLYKVNWTIKTYVKDAGMPSREETLISLYKFTMSKDRAEDKIKELEKAAELLGLKRELKTGIEELEMD